MIRTFVVSVVARAAERSSPLGAQYFGRNKVEYVDFDFRILATEHFDVYYYPREERAARMAAQLAERWYARFSTLLNHDLRLAPAAGALRQPGRVRADQCRVGAAAGFGWRRHRCGRAAASPCRLRRRWRKPIACSATRSCTRFNSTSRASTAATPAQPLWFIEGMAEYLSRGSLDSESSLWLRDAVLSDQLAREAGRGGARAVAVSLRPCVLVVSRRPLRRRHRREGAEARQEAAPAEGSHASRHRRGSRRAVRRLAARGRHAIYGRRARGLGSREGVDAASTCSSGRRSVPTARRRCSSPSAIACRSICSSPMSTPAA